MKPIMKVSYFSIFVLLVGLAVGVTAQAASEDEPIVGRWTFPMDQIYTFKADGTFSSQYVSGSWERGRMDDKTSAIEYHVYGGKGDKDEILTLNRGDREGHEYESGHVLRLNQQMRVKKLPERAEDSFSGNTDSGPKETQRSHKPLNGEYDGQIGGSQAVFRLRFEDAEVTGTYSQGDNTYRIQGKLENGRLLLDEYTGEQLTAHIKLDADGEHGWKGTMHNVSADKKQ